MTCLEKIDQTMFTRRQSKKYLIHYFLFYGVSSIFSGCSFGLGFGVIISMYDFVSFFLPHLNSLTYSGLWRLQRNYWRKEEKRPGYLLYFDFISEFNNHSVGDEIIPEFKWNGCVFQTKYLNVLVVFGQICPLFGVFSRGLLVIETAGRCVHYSVLLVMGCW